MTRCVTSGGQRRADLKVMQVWGKPTMLGDFMDDEYVVYDENAIRATYLIAFETEDDDDIESGESGEEYGSGGESDEVECSDEEDDEEDDDDDEDEEEDDDEDDEDGSGDESESSDVLDAIAGKIITHGVRVVQAIKNKDKLSGRRRLKRLVSAIKPVVNELFDSSDDE